MPTNAHIFTYTVLLLSSHFCFNACLQLFLRGLPKLCQKMKRPAKTPHGMTMPSTGAHPDFYSMSLYAPLPDQVIPAAAPTVATSTIFSGSDTSDQDGVVTNSSLSAPVSTSYPGTSSDSDRHGISSDSDRNGSSRDDPGSSDEGDRNTSGGSSDGRDESTHGGLSGSDRNSGYNEDSGSDHMEDYQVQTAIVVIMKTRDLIRVAPMLSA